MYLSLISLLLTDNVVEELFLFCKGVGPVTINLFVVSLKAVEPNSQRMKSRPAKVYFTLLTTHYVHLQRVTTRARLTISIKARRNRNSPNFCFTVQISTLKRTNIRTRVPWELDSFVLKIIALVPRPV